ncbi:MAG: ABC transporter ATP-binding protein [Nitrososphaerales archaeon]|nr:ABC transporter ATP-binding protein [Nitrososphaerales archaeon]
MSSGLVVDSVSVSYGNIAAVWDASLNVGDGEIVAVLGANGAGKSTLLKAIMGLVAASKGRISFRGQQMSGLRPHVLVARGIAYVPEGRRLFPKLSVEENLRVGAPGKCSDLAQRFNATYDAFPLLAERKHQLAGTLSGGEQQMLAIGRGMMAKPAMLLIDEPSLGLSPSAVDAVVASMTKVNQGGVGILFAEQNAGLALEVAQRAYVMENGCISTSGMSSDLLTDPAVRTAYLGNGG